MIINFIIFLFFGGIVLGDTYKHKKDRSRVANILMVILGLVSICVGIYQIVPEGYFA